MTREQVIKRFRNEVDKKLKWSDFSFDFEMLLHSIYDDFEAEEKRTLKDYEFTNCNDCIHKIDNKFTKTCLSCKRYYGCYFEKRINNGNRVLPMN